MAGAGSWAWAGVDGGLCLCLRAGATGEADGGWVPVGARGCRCCHPSGLWSAELKAALSLLLAGPQAAHHYRPVGLKARALRRPLILTVNAFKRKKTSTRILQAAPRTGETRRKEKKNKEHAHEETRGGDGMGKEEKKNK